MTRRLQEVDGKFTLNIPREIVLAMKWEKGTEIYFTLEGKGELSLALRRKWPPSEN